MPATSSAWPAVCSVQAITAQLYRLFGGQYAGRFHMAVRHALLMDRRERTHQGFGHFPAFLRREGLALQNVGEALLDVLHDGINHQGVVDPDLPDLGNGHQVRLLQLLRGLRRAMTSSASVRASVRLMVAGVLCGSAVSVSNHALRPSDRTRRRKG